MDRQARRVEKKHGLTFKMQCNSPSLAGPGLSLRTESACQSDSFRTAYRNKALAHVIELVKENLQKATPPMLSRGLSDGLDFFRGQKLQERQTDDRKDETMKKHMSDVSTEWLMLSEKQKWEYVKQAEEANLAKWTRGIVIQEEALERKRKRLKEAGNECEFYDQVLEKVVNAYDNLVVASYQNKQPHMYNSPKFAETYDKEFKINSSDKTKLESFNSFRMEPGKLLSSVVDMMSILSLINSKNDNEALKKIEGFVEHFVDTYPVSGSLAGANCLLCRVAATDAELAMLPVPAGALHLVVWYGSNPKIFQALVVGRVASEGNYTYRLPPAGAKWEFFNGRKLNDFPGYAMEMFAGVLRWERGAGDFRIQAQSMYRVAEGVRTMEPQLLKETKRKIVVQEGGSNVDDGGINGWSGEGEAEDDVVVKRGFNIKGAADIKSKTSLAFCNFAVRFPMLMCLFVF